MCFACVCLPKTACYSPSPPPNSSTLSGNSTTWAATAGHRKSQSRTRNNANGHVPPPTSSTPTSPSIQTWARSETPIASLRLSLDERRRAIESGRRRTMEQTSQATARRNHHAFQKLLQHRRRSDRYSEGSDCDTVSMDDWNTNSSSILGCEVISTSSNTQPPPSNSYNGDCHHHASRQDSPTSTCASDITTDVDDGVDASAVSAPDRVRPRTAEVYWGQREVSSCDD